ncbi:MAG: hypothetical protein KAQ68_11115 [Clostridiales bacterium]|nr:hypothetical protein [Clostridiales bacterium]
MTSTIIKEAIHHGFDDAYLLPIIESKNDAYNVKKILPDATSVLLLIKKHHPYLSFPESSMSVQSHYPTYQVAYHLSKSFITKLVDKGVHAKNANELPLKTYASTAGLQTLNNSLTYHPVFGSYIVIQAILTNATPHSYRIPKNDVCSDCTRCIDTCPTKAISVNGIINQSKCIRNHVPVKEIIPDYIKVASGSSYIGCGICQSVCPQNKSIKKVEPPKDLVDSLDISSMLDIKNNKVQIEKLANIIGKNEVRPNRALATTCLVACNLKEPKYLSYLKIILSTYISSLPRSYAAQAIGKIGMSDAFLYEVLKKEKDPFVRIEIASALIEQ